MDFSSSQWLQLNFAAVFAVIGLVFVYLAPARWVVLGLILIIPFQIISSRYGSLNIYLVYLVAFVFFLKGRLQKFPLIGFVGAIVLAYAISLSQTHPVTRGDHLLYLFFIGSNFLLFYVVYNYYREVRDPRGFLYLLLALNVLILLYSVAQLIVGLNPNSPLFSGEIGLKPPRADGRLSGPFGTVGLTAEYFVIAVFVIGFMLVTMKFGNKVKMFLVLLLLGNFAMLIATGNRGGIFTLVIAGVFFLFLFRKEMGVRGILISLGTVFFAFAFAASIIINYTDFNLLFDRLAETEIDEEGLPDTRSNTWPAAWARIQERPIVGQGPQLQLVDEIYGKPGAPPRQSWPHSLYLTLLDSIGIVGFVAYMAFLLRLLQRYYSHRNNFCGDPTASGLPRLAIVVMLIFFVDQIKIEFLRSEATEYQHFLFMLWGSLLALTEGVRSSAIPREMDESGERPSDSR